MYSILLKLTNTTADRWKYLTDDEGVVYVANTIEEVEAKDPTDEIKAIGLRRVSFRGISLPLPRYNRRITDNGWYGDDHPRTATKEWGEEMLQTTADFLVDYMQAFQKIKTGE